MTDTTNTCGEGAELKPRDPITHALKTWPEAYDAIEAGLKGWELRKKDRDYRVGDFLLLRRWSLESGYDGSQRVERVVWILDGGQFGLPRDYCIMSLERVPTQQAAKPGEGDPLRHVRDAASRIVAEIEGIPPSQGEDDGQIVEVTLGDIRHLKWSLDALTDPRVLTAGASPSLVEACRGIADDYQTSDNHHPDHVLIPRDKFEAILAALKTVEA